MVLAGLLYAAMATGAVLLWFRPYFHKLELVLFLLFFWVMVLLEVVELVRAPSK
jgi:hypothetical protein